MNNNRVIEVKGLSKSFDEREVLRNISFTINRREITVILGRSGSGKSTILKHMLGLYPLEPGVVRILSHDIAALDDESQLKFYMQIGVLFQNGALLNSLRVADNISLALEQHSSLPENIIEEMVRMKLSLVNLDQAYDLYPSELSGGMLKRAALARAIIMDPPLLFCDEPGSGLDPVSLTALDQLILDLRKQLGMTVVMITHEVPSIMRIADRIIFIEDAQISFTGTPKEALASDNPALKAFFEKPKAISGKLPESGHTL